VPFDCRHHLADAFARPDGERSRLRRGLEGDGDGSVRRYVLRDALVGPDVGVAGGEMKGADQVSPGEQDLLAESRKAVVQQRGPGPDPI